MGYGGEADVENYFKQQVQLIGGHSYKWNSEGVKNVPDQICFLPEGIVWFIEIKAFNRELKDSQKRSLGKIAKMGQRVGWVQGYEGVDDFLIIANDKKVMVFDGVKDRDLKVKKYRSYKGMAKDVDT